jgi:hypothetical protein
VDDAANRTPLSGWMKMPENASSSSWLCPYDYNWTTLTEIIPAKVAQYGPVNEIKQC